NLKRSEKPETREAWDSEQQSGLENKLINKGEWTVIRNKKSVGPVSVEGSACLSVTSLKAVEPRKYFHLWNPMCNP
ncbi:jg70, partial [Pararge aegeria aegeria]